MTGAEVVTAARTQIGVPWVHQGRLWGEALDCAGLIICTARELGLVAPDFDVTGYGRAPDGTMLRLLAQHCEQIIQMELGAVLCIATAREPQHLGIVADYVHGGWSLVHATNSGQQKVVETRIVGMKVRGIYRLPGVA